MDAVQFGIDTFYRWGQFRQSNGAVAAVGQGLSPDIQAYPAIADRIQYFSGCRNHLGRGFLPPE